MMRRLLIPLLILGPCGGAVHLPPMSPGQELACPPPSARGVGGIRVEPGRYDLTLVAVRDGRPSRSTRASLWLRRTSARDRSPSTGRAPIRVDTVENYLYGATTLDVRQVGAATYVDPAVNGEGIPLGSADPVRPGVLVRRRHEDGGAVLWMGASGNARDEPGGLDGPGLVLTVAEAVMGAYRGRWSGAGSLRGPDGYFCLVPVTSRGASVDPAS